MCAATWDGLKPNTGYVVIVDYKAGPFETKRGKATIKPFTRKK